MAGGQLTKFSRKLKVCTVEGCTKIAKGRVCPMHERRFRRNGHYGLQDRPNRRPDGAGGLTAAGYVNHNARGERKYEHIIVAERVLGRPLPPGAQVHHVDGNPANNIPTNLVICPSDAYHKLLHIRQRAMDECGNPNFRKCWVCKAYDDPANLRIRTDKQGRETVVHLVCERNHSNARWVKRRLQRHPNSPKNLR